MELAKATNPEALTNSRRVNWFDDIISTNYKPAGAAEKVKKGKNVPILTRLFDTPILSPHDNQRSLERYSMTDNRLTAASFDSLLTILGPDRESAARAYLDLRLALFTYFATRDVANPDEMADETINRVARRLSEGERITTGNPANYFYGVARNVWRESLAKGNVLIPLSDENSAGVAQDTTPYDLLLSAQERIESEIRHECLEKCLGSLAPEDRELIISYHQFSGGKKIENRKNLAERFGLSNNALRQKVARLKSRLGECVIICQRSRARSDLE
jgi:RNA polymerase sigma factor (sigma-70 family)